MVFRPLLASKIDDIEALRYPVWGSAKLDGIRCLIVDGEPVTRSLKPIPNIYIQQMLRGLPAFDGELTIGDPQKPTTWNETTKGVMAHHGTPKFTYWVFDLIEPGAEFSKRFSAARDLIRMLPAGFSDHIRIHDHFALQTHEELSQLEDRYVRMGFEGLMLRDPNGIYKTGRSTEKEGILLKVKRFDDAEGVITGFKERLQNVAESKVNERGYKEKDHKLSNMVGAGDLGAFICALTLPNGKTIEFDVGSGLNHFQRSDYWNRQAELVGRIITFKHQGWTPNEKPRCPIFKGFRMSEDT